MRPEDTQAWLSAPVVGGSRLDPPPPPKEASPYDDPYVRRAVQRFYPDAFMLALIANGDPVIDSRVQTCERFGHDARAGQCERCGLRGC